MLIVEALYHRPKSSDQTRSNKQYIQSSLEKILPINPNVGIIITGDFIQMKTSRICSGFVLSKIVDKLTGGSNILDLIMTNMQGFYDVPKIIGSVGNSDHRAVLKRPS